MSIPGSDGLPRNTILIGDARRHLATIPAGAVDTVITSPPYFQLRDYGRKGQIGLEDHVDGWVDELRAVMGGVARVLKETGSVWLNLGDTYSRQDRYGAPPKSLLLGPERLALRLIDDGWTIRSKVIWAKTAAMPNPVRDRLTCAWEVVYLLTRTRRYYFDLDRIRVPHRSARRPARQAEPPPGVGKRPSWAGPLAGSNAGLDRMKARGVVGHPLGKNPTDVWALPVSNFRGAHHATFPTNLVERPLLATCPERTCRKCGEPWRRLPAKHRGTVASLGSLQPGCDCRAGWSPGLVLDPFFGAGTVGVVAEAHQRDWLGIELNPAFARIAEQRIVRARTDTRDGSRHAPAA